MAYIKQRITIINIRKPAEHAINEELQWLGTSLGLFNLRDKDKSMFRIFIELLKSAKKHRPMTSDELSAGIGLSRGTVLHHVNKLIESGLVIHEGNKYLLRVENLQSLIEEVEKDVKRACDDLKEIAKQIDDALGI